jgi:hypothetical protein
MGTEDSLRIPPQKRICGKQVTVHVPRDELSTGFSEIVPIGPLQLAQEHSCDRSSLYNDEGARTERHAPAKYLSARRLGRKK